MRRILSLIFITLAMVMMQALEFIPHHHHDGIVICFEHDDDEEDDDETLCVKNASFLMNDTHHEFDFSALIPVFEAVSIQETPSFMVAPQPLDQILFYSLFYPGPSGLRAPPVSIC